MTDSQDAQAGHEGHEHGNCEEALHELYSFLDGELTEHKRTQIRDHLDDCSPCLEAFDFEAELRIVIKHRCKDEVPESLRDRVAEKLASFDLSAAASDPLDVADSSEDVAR
jgi:mycothiol system anti-sigma-R factor